VNYVSVLDNQAIETYKFFAKTEGIIPALESSHAIAYVLQVAPKMQANEIILFNLSGRGDKDIHTVNEFEAINNN
jgi:tryptophan synthase beta chain